MLQPATQLGDRIVRGPNGERGIYRNGQIIPIEASAKIQAPPMVEVIPPRADTPPAQTPLQVENDKLTNERLRQQIEAEGELTPKDRAALLERQELLGGFNRSIDEIEDLYTNYFEGEKGGVLGMGGDRNVGGYLPDLVRPENQRLESASNTLIGMIANVQGTTGGEMNSLAEMKARFGPMLPQPTDNDATIKDKIARLRAMAEEQRRAVGLQLGQSPTATETGAEPPSAATPDTTKVTIADAGDGNLNVNGGTQTVVDESLKAIAPQIGELVTRGATKDQISEYMASKDVNPALLENLDDILRQRSNPNSDVAQWIKQNPGKPYPIISTYEVPLSATDKIVSNIASGPAGAYGMAAGNVITGNRLDNLVGMTGGDAELANALMGQVRSDNPLASFAGDVSGGIGLYGGGRAGLNALSRYLPQLGRIQAGTKALSPGALAGDATLGGYLGSGAEGTDPFSVGGALKGAAIGAGGGAVARGGINALAGVVSPTGGRLAPLYEEGVQPTIGQRMGAAEGPISGPLGRGANRLEQAMASIPLVGGVQRSARNSAVDEMQRGAFNQALREIDVQLPKSIRNGTRAHAFMQDSFNKVYDKARSQMRFKSDPQFQVDFQSVLKDVELLPKDSQNIFFKMAENVGQRYRRRGKALTGDDYKLFVSRIDKKVRAIRKNPSGDHELADALEGLALALDDGARRHSPPEAVDLLNKADRGYAKAVIIEDAARRRGGDAGEFSGTQLDAAVQNTSGGVRSRRYLRGQALMQEYAQAAKALGDNVPDSGTPERLMAAGALGGAAGLVHPATAAPWIANTLATAPGGRQIVNAAIAPNRKKAMPARKFLERKAKLGGLFGITLVEQNAQ